MRKIDNYFESPPESMTLKSLTKTREGGKQSVIEEVLKTQRIESKDYNRPNVKETLLNIYGDCCAFCEKRISQHDDIEHYRPKHEITGVNKTGYYWLGFVWSNLVVACKECNVSFKQNHFPLEDESKRVLSPSAQDTPTFTAFFENCHIESKDLVNENPLLLHPVLDDPSKHLVFNHDGTVSAKNGSKKGECSILYYGLNSNKRRILIIDRHGIIEDTRRDVRLSIYHFCSTERLCTDIENILTGLYNSMQIKETEKTRPIHSAVRRACIEQFVDFFVDSEKIYTKEQKNLLRDTYSEIKKRITDLQI